MLKLTGEYEHVIDEKNRLFISTKLRSKVDAEKYGSDWILALSIDGILCLYPEKCYEQMLAELAADSNIPDDDFVVIERLYFAFATTVEFDKQGRLLIHEKLKKRANLGNKLTLVGVRDHIEIWNSEDWERFVAEKAAGFEKHLMRARKSLLQKQTQKVVLPDEENLQTLEE
jgi:MraZ protein